MRTANLLSLVLITACSSRGESVTDNCPDGMADDGNGNCAVIAVTQMQTLTLTLTQTLAETTQMRTSPRRLHRNPRGHGSKRRRDRDLLPRLPELLAERDGRDRRGLCALRTSRWQALRQFPTSK